MIELTRLNYDKFYVNLSSIQYVERTPDTAVVFMNGDRILVRETVEDVVDRAMDYERELRTGVIRVRADRTE